MNRDIQLLTKVQLLNSFYRYKDSLFIKELQFPDFFLQRKAIRLLIFCQAYMMRP